MCWLDPIRKTFEDDLLIPPLHRALTMLWLCVAGDHRLNRYVVEAKAARNFDGNVAVYPTRAAGCRLDLRKHANLEEVMLGIAVAKLAGKSVGSRSRHPDVLPMRKKATRVLLGDLEQSS